MSENYFKLLTPYLDLPKTSKESDIVGAVFGAVSRNERNTNIAMAPKIEEGWEMTKLERETGTHSWSQTKP